MAWQSGLDGVCHHDLAGDPRFPLADADRRDHAGVLLERWGLDAQRSQDKEKPGDVPIYEYSLQTYTSYLGETFLPMIGR